MKRLFSTLAVCGLIALSAIGPAALKHWDDALASRPASPKTPYGRTALEIDGAPARDLEIESMRARIDDLESDLAAREEELEDLANTLNGAIADRNEAIAILRANGWDGQTGRLGDSAMGSEEGRGE
jgi:hypothetical protein